jgi:hypothetical protein
MPIVSLPLYSIVLPQQHYSIYGMVDIILSRYVMTASMRHYTDCKICSQRNLG